MAKSYYEILGVSKSANADELKSAYRKLAKQYHPDINKEKGANERFAEINKAYETLSDPEKKKMYDQFGEAGVNGQGFGGAGSGGFGGFSGFGGFGQSTGGFSGGFGFEDIFDMFTGGGFSRGRKQQGFKGEDINMNLNITFKESVFGIKKQIAVTKTRQCDSCKGTGAKSESDFIQCQSCGGSGQVRRVQNTLFGQISNISTCGNCKGTGKIIKNPCSNCGGKGMTRQSEDILIEIPAGIASGQTITYQGMGNAGSRPEYNGDLNVTVNCGAHPILKRDGFDLRIELHVPFTTCALGGEIRVPMADGFMNLKIPALTQSGTVIRERGRGIKKLNQAGTGDLIITIITELPKNLDRTTKQVFESLKKNESINDYEKFKKFNDQMKSLQ